MKITKEYCRKGQDPTIFAELSRISSEYYDLLRNSNMSSIYKKAWLLTTNTDLKVYWNVLKNFLNNIKILSVPAILLSGKTRRNILEKANIFNKLFAS